MNIVFLDIDGPMKPARLYFDTSVQVCGGGFDRVSVAVVNRLCDRCDAAIVFNTTWNMMRDPDIVEIARKEGITATILGRTNYPKTESRLNAITDWIKTHPAVQAEKWVALDDARIDHENAVRVNPEYGIGISDYNSAAKILGYPDERALVLL